MSHVGTDFDGLASMVLAQKLYPGSYIVFPGRIGPGVKEFYDLHKRHFPALATKEALEQKPDRIIVVDTRIPSRLGAFRAWVHDSEVELHIYDHHPPTAEAVRGDQEWVEPVGAAATLLVERCLERGIAVEKEIASLSLIAIHEETGSFRYSSTTARDLQAAAYLMEHGANLDVVGDFLKDPLTEEQRSLLEEFLKEGRMLEGQGGRLYVCPAKRERSVFGLGSLASRILDIQGADAVCAVLEVTGEGTTIAARAGSDVYNVSAWMGKWGGGGHKRAASASRIDRSATEVAGELAGLLGEGSPSHLKAGQVMSSELFTVRTDITVTEAYTELLQRGYQSAVVVDDQGDLQGLVSRTDLDRALAHNLGHAPARSVMTHKVVSVDYNDTLEDVRKIVVERHVGSLPVLKDGKLVGIVTRSDLLRELYQQQEEQNWFRAGGGPRLSLSTVGEPEHSRLRAAASLANQRKERLYVVGGFVRDLLLGRRSGDLDLVLEGDAIEMARVLSKQIGGKVLAHEKYLTATLKFSDSDKLDIASARREVYVRPAALPDVAQSKLKSDLYRRDFTINALALRLSDFEEATVIDFFGGRGDIEAKKIRVLHNHSFIDDPTRILRAVRFEQRLGFSIEPHTMGLLKGALETDIFQMAHGERMAEEIKLSLSEHDPIKVLTRLDKLKVLKAIHPEFKFGQKQKERTERALEFLHRYPDFVPSERQWSVPLAFLYLELSENGRESLYERFGWRMAAWPQPMNKLLGSLTRQRLDAAQLAVLLDSLSPIQVATLCGVAGHPQFDERVEHYMKRTKDMVPLITGNEILAHGIAPGPEVAEWKRRAYAAQRNEEFSDAQEAADWLDRVLGPVRQ